MNQPPTSNWPLVIVLEDCFVPELAGEILKVEPGRSAEVNYAVIYALALYAESELRGVRLN